MSKVIKNDDGVVVVEGTPSARLVKDSNKFFATKPPERMAGESISPPRKIDNIKPVEDKARYTGGSKDFNERTGRVDPNFRDSQKKGRRPSFESLSAEEQAEVTARKEERMEKREKRANFNERHGRPVGGNPNRNEAKNKAESRRRFFERRRSKKEAERSQEEQEATQGRFITTLGR